MADAEIDQILILLEERNPSIQYAHDFTPALHAVSAVTPEILQLTVKLMTTGSSLAQDDTAATIRLLLRGINENKEAASKWLTHEDVYREQVENYTNRPLSVEMTMRWHFFNVAADMGMTRTDAGRIIGFAVNNCASRNYNDEQSVEYWRGFAALHLASGGNVFLLQPEAHERFIEWAGKSDDLSRIITLALERESLDVEQLAPLISEQDSVARSIREGAL